MTWSITRSNRTRVGVGLVIAFVTISVLFVPSVLAQDSGEVEVEIANNVEEAVVGEEITVEAEVTNGRADANELEIAFEINGSEVASQSTDRLEPGETTTVRFNYTVSKQDSPGFNAAVSSDDSRDERNISVSRRFGIEIVEGPPDSVTAGEVIELTAEVKNMGPEANGTAVILNAGDSEVTRSVDIAANDSAEINFSYPTDRRDLGPLGLEVGVEEQGATGSVQVVLPDDDPFAVERTGEKQLTVTLDEAEVGSGEGMISEGNQTITLQSSQGGLIWNLADGAEGGIYQRQFSIESFSSDRSLVDATVEIDGTDLSDTVHLHTIDQTTLATWADDETVYIPTDTTGVQQPDEVNVSISLSGSRLNARFEDSNTIAVDIGAVRGKVDPHTTETGTFQTDGASVGSIDGFGPDIRYVQGEVVLWHPYIESQTEYTVSIEAIDGQAVEQSINTTAERAGVVPVPMAETVAGAGNVTLSVERAIGDRTLFDSLNVTEISEKNTMNASVIDGETLDTERSLELLSVSSVLVVPSQRSTEPIYLSGDEVETDGTQLRIPGAALDTGQTVQVATNAGIITVKLVADEGSPISAFLIPSLFIIGGLGGLAGGGLLGRRLGLPTLDLTDAVLLGTSIVGAAGLFVADLLVDLPIPGDTYPHHLWVFLVAVSGLVAYTLSAALFHKSVDRYGQTGTTTTRQREKTVTRQVKITDGNQKIKDRIDIEATDDSGSHPKTRSSTISGGDGTITLPTGRWKLQAKLQTSNSTHTSSPVREKFRDSGRKSAIELRIPLPDITVSVRDGTNPIPEASVRMTTDSEARTERTGSDGRVTFDTPLDADPIMLSVSHEKYEEKTVERSLDGGGISETIELQRRTGRLKIVSRVDTVETGGIDVSIRTDEAALERIYDRPLTGKTTTADDGSVLSDELIVGQYRVGLDLPKGSDRYFETSRKQVSVGQRKETVTLDAEFTWNLSDQQRQRIKRIRSELEDVTSSSGIDIAIPQYYASAVESVLEAVESLPQQGHHFVGSDADPDEVADAIIEAAADTAETISRAMSTKRNLDLFAACSDMPEANVQWRGSFDIGTLIDRLQKDPMTVRRSFAEHADRVSERIDTERGDLSEIAPARELLERVDIDDTRAEVESIVSVHVAILLFTAIEELFEHRELRERLSQTVF